MLILALFSGESLVHKVLGGGGVYVCIIAQNYRKILFFPQLNLKIQRHFILSVFLVP
jgi:hypothetical protein